MIRPLPVPAARPTRRRLLLAGGLLVAALSLGDLPAGADPAPGRATSSPSGAPAEAAPGVPSGDDPVPGNLPSPVLAEVQARSSELSARVDDRLDVERSLAEAERHRDDLRSHLADLVVDRSEAVDLLGRRRTVEAVRIDERVAATEVHGQRVEEAREAQSRVGRAQDDLREVVIAAYMAAGGARTGPLSALIAGSDPSGDLLRERVGASSTDAREADLADRTRELDRAIEARTRAREALDDAEAAEAAAIEARQTSEQEIRDIDADAETTRAEEAEAVVSVGRRTEDVLRAVAAEIPARLRAQVVGVDFPVVALDAWVKAAAAAPCRTPWWALAGISKIESRHGTYRGGRLGARGYPSVAIIGPRLDGNGGFAAIHDTDGGLLDGDAAWDRAVGPMQFIPSTWARWGRDGDGDGQRDPHSIYDAAAAAAAYLCYGRSDLGDEAQLRAGYFSYNHSQAYVSAVLAAAHGYRAALTLPT